MPTKAHNTTTKNEVVTAGAGKTGVTAVVDDVINYGSFTKTKLRSTDGSNIRWEFVSDASHTVTVA
jgi:hypothetical protein